MKMTDRVNRGDFGKRAMSRYFLPYQIDYIMDETRLVLYEKSIRIGITYAAAFRAVRRRVLGLGNYLHTSVNERVAKSFVTDCKRFCEIFEVTAASEIDEFSLYNPIMDRQESAFQIVIGKVAIKAFSSNPDALRGEGGEVGVDEITSHRSPKELIKAAGGRAMWGYPVRIWSSHKGEESDFNTLIKQERAKGGESAWKIVSTDLFVALDQGLLEKINEVRRAECESARAAFAPISREEFVAETIAVVGGQEAFEEECLLKPMKGGGSAVTWLDIEAAQDEKPIVRFDCVGSVDGNVADVVAESIDADVTATIGYDVARTGDLSVVWVNQAEGQGWRQVAMITMSGTKFHVQREVVSSIMRSRRNVVAAGDKTGLGMQICEELTDEFGEARFIGINFSSMKPDLGTRLQKTYQDGRQKIPKSEQDIAYDLAAIRVQPLPSGRPQFFESPNPVNKKSHCDMAWANALALLAGDEAASGGCGVY